MEISRQYTKTVKRIASAAKQELSKPYARAGLAVVSAIGLATIINDPSMIAQAANDTINQTVASSAPPTEYGFWSGALDGLLYPINLVMSLVDGSDSWARDGAGVISESGAESYMVGYVLAVVGECTVIANTVVAGICE